jgi:calcium-dependent protein kinase
MRTLTNHPNVIKLYETFEGDNTYYFVMEIVEGTSLYDEIKNHSATPYKDDEIRDILKMLIAAIAYCADKNIMHRDLKPENILFAKRG